MYIGKTPTVGNFQVCDAISVVNGQAAYTMQINSTNVEPESANHMLVSLNGILQKPGSSFTISGSTITFASNLATGDVIDFITLLGNVLDIGQPSDDTVTAAKLNNDVISGQTALTAEPDDTDEFLVSDAGTIKRIDYSLIKGSGKILQVVSSSTQTQSNTTSSTFQATALTANITPSATSSKILILVSYSHYANNGDSRVTIYRDSTNLFDSTKGKFSFASTDVVLSDSTLDSPNTTSQVTYTVYHNASAGTSYFLPASNLTATMVLLEVGA